MSSLHSLATSSAERAASDDSDDDLDGDDDLDEDGVRPPCSEHDARLTSSESGSTGHSVHALPANFRTSDIARICRGNKKTSKIVN
jgi:hypothetical protein